MMKNLILDVETAPNTADVWALFQQNVSLSQLRVPSYMMCWSAKWYGERKVKFASIFHDGKPEMLKQIHSLMEEADVITHYNGKRFDIPVLNKEFLLAKMLPPAPSKHIDLYQVVKRQFRFASNKLDHITKELGLEHKLAHSGHELWVRCMIDDPKAWAKMRQYNKQDVVITEQVYDRILPWIDNHPNMGFYGGVGCPNCGADELFSQRRGYAYLTTGVFQRYQCVALLKNDVICGSWWRGKNRLEAVNTLGVKL